MGWLNRVRANTRSLSRAPSSFVSLDFHLHEMRVQKSRAEMSLLRKACKISGEGHLAAMRVCQPGQMEYELEASLVEVYRRHDATHSFLPIVGGGENGCILHYTENDCSLKDGDLVLVDSGAEYRYYAGDITRTYPVNGKFSAAQKSVYELVLDSQLAAIEQVKSGNHWNDPHTAAVKVLTKGLVKLGLLKGKVSKLIRMKLTAASTCIEPVTGLVWMCMMSVNYKIDGEWRLLEPGMVLTVEPGLYIGKGRGIPAKYANIGIRIEDDVLVTKDGHEVLTQEAPKTVKEIEALMGQ